MWLKKERRGTKKNCKKIDNSTLKNNYVFYVPMWLKKETYESKQHTGNHRQHASCTYQ
ncbi:MAG: hypothetical protein JWQ09_3967 [Segetibacter sp.]|nr:hypothetical protein [Segetibacter sp.]